MHTQRVDLYKKQDKSIYFTFAKESARNLKQIGSIVPDSNVCIDALLKHVPFETADLILEFGAGSGSVTRRMIQRKRPETSLVSFEKNQVLFNRLQGSTRGEKVSLVRGDAFYSLNARSNGTVLRSNSVDCIVSTLPCSLLDFEGLLDRAVVPLLKPGGIFIQYTHAITILKGFRLKPLLSRRFPRIDSGFVLRNFPPALIYSCCDLII